jgi:hypothetical protein
MTNYRNCGHYGPTAYLLTVNTAIDMRKMGHLYNYELGELVELLVVYLLANEGGYYQIDDNIATRFIFKWLIPSTYQFSLTSILNDISYVSNNRQGTVKSL